MHKSTALPAGVAAPDFCPQEHAGPDGQSERLSRATGRAGVLPSADWSPVCGGHSGGFEVVAHSGGSRITARSHGDGSRSSHASGDSGGDRHH